MKNIAFPHSPGAGGPGSFQERIQKEFESMGWTYSHGTDLMETPDAVFVVGGTRRLGWLYRMKRKGVPILYRLDGILWMHRKKWPGIKKYLTNEIRNALMKCTHGYIADHVVYQSTFVRHWWRNAAWRQPKKSSVIRNGVDVNEFAPKPANGGQGVRERVRRVICVEGNLDYSPYAVKLLGDLAEELGSKNIRVEVYGSFANPKSLADLSGAVVYHGSVSRSGISEVYTDGIYLSLDVQAACPNTVMEAMSSGLPVVGFATGALPELVPNDCGVVVEYGADPWSLEFPDVGALAEAIVRVSDRYDWYAENALVHARKEYSIEEVAAAYAEIIDGLIAGRTDAG